MCSKAVGAMKELCVMKNGNFFGMDDVLSDGCHWLYALYI